MATKAYPRVETHGVSRRALASGPLLGVAAAVLLLLLAVASVTFGSRSVSWEDIISGVFGTADTIAQAAVAQRVPRTLLAIVVGGSLALSGLGMQAVTRNPLADPGIFGVSNGASFAVVLGIVYLGTENPYLQMALAVAGSAAAAVFVFRVGSIGPSGASPLKLALAGAATAAAIASMINIVLLPRVDALQSYQFWQIGGVGGATWEKLRIVVPFLLAAVVAMVLLSRRMNVLALGEDVAVGLGEDVTKSRIYITATAVSLAGIATSVAGPIGFVGLIVPHFCRLLVGPNYRTLVPLTALFGAALLLASDVVGRAIARPQEVPVGIVTALIGAPFFIWIVRRQKVREL